MTGIPGASLINTALTCPTYGPTSPKSVNRTIITDSMPCVADASQGGAEGGSLTQTCWWIEMFSA